MINFAMVEKLLELLSRSDVDTIEIRKWTTTIRVSKSAGVGPAPAVSYQAAPSPVVGPPGLGGGEGAGQEHVAPASDLVEIKAPMVGTYYAQPEPGVEPYVQVGSRIKPGQTLCIIEAMKIMNPIESEISGVIREVAVKDATPVEFGQALFKVDPNG